MSNTHILEQNIVQSIVFEYQNAYVNIIQV